MSEAAVHARPGGTVAIVTGASRGAGRVVVFELTRRGCAVVVVYLRDRTAAEAVVDDVDGAGGTALAVRADVTDGLDVERLFDETISAFGVVDVVVHAARRDARELLEQAVHRLRRSGAVLTFATAGAIKPALAEKLRASGLTVTELGGGPSCPADGVRQLVELMRARPAVWCDDQGMPGRDPGVEMRSSHP